MGSGSTILGIVLIFVFGIAGIYGLAMGVINGILPLWEMVYAAAYLHLLPPANWLYYTAAQLILVWVLVPLWTMLCVMGVTAGYALMGDY
jgi:hypothetical protein